MIEFKVATPRDWPEIQKIARKTWPDTFGSLIPEDQLEYMLDLIYSEESLKRQIVETGHRFIFPMKDEFHLGYASYEIHYQSQPQLMIHKFYLLPIFQGLGIGKMVLNLLTEIALQNNDTQLRLKVFYKNAKAIEFYKRNGFIKIGDETTELGNNFSVIDYIMIKKLV